MTRTRHSHPRNRSLKYAESRPLSPRERRRPEKSVSIFRQICLRSPTSLRSDSLGEVTHLADLFLPIAQKPNIVAAQRDNLP